MVQQRFSDLTQRCINIMGEAGYSRQTIERYSQLWSCYIKPFMEGRGTDIYSMDIGTDFLSSMPEDVEGKFNPYRRCITILNSVLESGKILRYIPQTASFDMSGEIGTHTVAFINIKRDEKMRPQTLYVFERMLGRLVVFLRLKNIVKLDDMQEQELLNFIDSSQINKTQRAYVLRGFCRYLIDEKLVPSHYGSLINGFRFPIREKLPSVYTEGEVEAINNAIPVKEYGGKRLYAAFMLSSRLGLRVSDIINLKFENIDWDNNIMLITQQKTGNIVKLPLIPEVGNAIIDYLRDERVTGMSNYVFLTLKAPYERVSRDTIYLGFQTAIRASKVNVERRHHGMHSMRHSLATQLLKKDVQLSVISDVLGHSSTQSTMNYLRVDMENLKKCLLEVPPVSSSFYTQKGGILYE